MPSPKPQPRTPHASAPRRTSDGRAPFFRHPLSSILYPLFAFAVFGCDDMSDNARFKPLERSTFFADGQLARPQVEGTVSRDPVALALTTTKDASGKQLAAFPFEITRDNLERGRQRYDIYCAVCHGALGYGDGMIVRRGFPAPPSFHDERLRTAPAGHYVEVIANGWGAMYSYSDRVGPEDRWNIAAYIQALQLSQRAEVTRLGEQDRQKLTEATTPRTSTAPATQEAH